MVAPETLRHLEFFKGMSLETVEAIINATNEVSKKGIIFNEGDKGDFMLIIIEGNVEVLTKKRKEGDYNVIAVLKPGDIIGEIALVGDKIRTAKCRTEQDKEIKVLELTEAAFSKLQTSNPKASLQIYEKTLKIIAQRFKRMAEKQDRWNFWL
ncbi:MAG: cyclic nucleotide-binding domain-containing protein [Candidatus Hydrogenedentota bacterium]